MADDYSPTPIRFGIVGCADIARKLCRAINLAPNSTLSAIASRSIDKAKRFASKNSLPETVEIYGGYDQVLEDPCVDAVYLPLPTSLHVQWAILAAQRKKHVLLEKPTALDVGELDQILEACRSNGVQFMDGTMWYHHLRTAKMKDLISDPKIFGQIKSIHSSSTYSATPEFFENNIRVKPDLDSLGSLGDLGWYCIGAILWAMDYQLPKTAVALPAIERNPAGVIFSCSACLHWENRQTVATFDCSFLSAVSTDLTLQGFNGSIHLDDFIIPFREDSAFFEFTTGAKFVDLHIGWNVKPERVEVASQLPQEALMVEEFARLVRGVRDFGSSPDSKWPERSRATQLVIDAVKRSIDLGFKPVSFY